MRARVGGSGRWLAGLLLACAVPVRAQVGEVLPGTMATSLAGGVVRLPGDLRAPATVLIVGFGRRSQEATTAWERPVRMQLARPGGVDFYDMAMLAEVPGLIRPMVVRAIRREVPEVLRANFLPLTEGEAAWKRVAGYTDAEPEAAYVLLVDRAGRVRWLTHAGFSAEGFAALRQQVEALVATPVR